MKPKRFEIEDQTIEIGETLVYTKHGVIDYIYDVDFNAIESIEAHKNCLVVSTPTETIKIACKGRERSNLELLISLGLCRSIRRFI